MREEELENENLNGFPMDGKQSLFESAVRYLKYWYWILLSIVGFSIAGIFYSKTQTPKYTLSLKLLIKDNGKSSDKDILEQLNLYSTEKIIDNEIQILKSDMLMGKVVENLQLQTSYYTDDKFKSIELYNALPFRIRLLKANNQSYKQAWEVSSWNDGFIVFNGKEIRYDKPTLTDAGLIIISHTPQKLAKKDVVYIRFNTSENLAGQFNSSISITPSSRQSTVLFITMEDVSADRGKDILNELASVYSQLSIENKNKTISNTLSFIESRLSSVASDLGNVEQDVQRYKSANQITDITSQASTFLISIQANDAQLSQIELGYAILKNLEDYLKGDGSDQMKVPALQGITDPTLNSLVSELSAAQLKKESLLRTVPQTNPVVNSLNDQIKALKITILQTIQNVRSGMALTRSQLRTNNQKLETLVKGVPVKERGLIDIMRDRDIKNNLFVFLLQKREEAAMSLAATVADSQTIDSAKSAGMFFKPAKNVIYIAFLSIGLLLPIGIIYFRGILDSTVKSEHDIELRTKTPIIGHISRSEDPLPLIVVEKPRSMVAEEVRALRTNLAFLLTEKKQKVILFTSSISGEGKSYVSLNLAASLASTGKKVIILELDLRKPRFNSMLNIERNAGLSNYLVGQFSWQQIVHKLPENDNLYVLTSGIVPPNPAELLLNGKIDILLDNLRMEFDYILLDAPPVGLLTDAQILSKFADCTMFLVRYGYTQKNQIGIVESYRKKRIFNKLSIVFNSANVKGPGYGYGYYEHQDEEKAKFFDIFKRKRI